MEDIGQKLRQAREEKGLTIQSVEERTKIQRRYLEAIEQGNFDQLPGDFYVRAFIKQYAEVVGLNGNELLSDFHTSVPTPQPEEYVENSNENKVQRVKATTNNKKGIWKNYIPHLLTVAGVLVALGIVYLVYVNVFANPNKSSAPAPDKVIVNSQIDESKSKTKTNKKANTDSSSNGQNFTISKDKNEENTYLISNLPQKDANIQISSTTDDVWSAISIDDEDAFQGIVSAGESKTIPLSADAKSIEINLGNTLSVNVKIAGQTVELGKKNNANAPVNLLFNVKTPKNTDK